MEAWVLQTDGQLPANDSCYEMILPNATGEDGVLTP
jgi:hypothetical protein